MPSGSSSATTAGPGLTLVDVEALPSGGFVLTYHDDYTAGAEFYAGRVIANGWQKFEDATAVPLTIYGGGVPDPALPQTATWVDEDGFLYCLYAYRETGGGVSKSLVLMRSTDEGGSWTNIGHTRRIRNAHSASRDLGRMARELRYFFGRWADYLPLVKRRQRQRGAVAPLHDAGFQLGGDWGRLVCSERAG